MNTLRLADLMSVTEVNEAITEGLVRVQTYPLHPYRILNYTEKAVYSKTWTPVTTQCRGLIIDEDDAVIARPFRKFFNYGEHASDALDLAAPVEVTDKLDGSLGILYRYPDGRPAIATRGSFGSDQAYHATLLYRAKYEGAWLPGTGFTYLFEIVYPENRIVRLWERAAVHDVLAVHPATTVKQLGQALRMDAMDVRAIIDAGPDWADEVRKMAPEEFTGWIDATIIGLHDQVSEVIDIVQGEAFGWGECDDRKTIALGIADHPFRGLVFAELDGKPWRSQAWAAVRPEAERPFAARGEDVA